MSCCVGHSCFLPCLACLSAVKLHFIFLYVKHSTKNFLQCRLDHRELHRLVFSWNTFIFQSILKDRLPGHNILGSQMRTLRAWNIAFHIYPVFVVANEGSGVILFFLSLYVNWWFELLLLVLFLCFCIWYPEYNSPCLWLFSVLHASCIWNSISFCKFYIISLIFWSFLLYYLCFFYIVNSQVSFTGHILEFLEKSFMPLILFLINGSLNYLLNWCLL